jgi:hypothetical protein
MTYGDNDTRTKRAPTMTARAEALSTKRTLDHWKRTFFRKAHDTKSRTLTWKGRGENVGLYTANRIFYSVGSLHHALVAGAPPNPDLAVTANMAGDSAYLALCWYLAKGIHSLVNVIVRTSRWSWPVSSSREPSTTASRIITTESAHTISF